jgi:hypothetical protein
MVAAVEVVAVEVVLFKVLEARAIRRAHLRRKVIMEVADIPEQNRTTVVAVAVLVLRGKAIQTLPLAVMEPHPLFLVHL